MPSKVLSRHEGANGALNSLVSATLKKMIWVSMGEQSNDSAISGISAQVPNEPRHSSAHFSTIPMAD